jgi:enolase-phosphatase E1
MILLDIEGTTTPIAFVTGVLFPYARTHLPAYLARHGDTPACAAVLARLRGEYEAERESGADVPPWSPAAYAGWLMDRDRKSGALKDLQGRVWDEGYRNGELVGQVFPDVRPAFERWRGAGVPIGIFSSGSVLAQQLLFRHSSAGDLTPFLTWHFDTSVGPKPDPASYARIAEQTGTSPRDVVFVSDVVRELDAARIAGMQTILSDRPGNAPQPKHDHRIVQSFVEISSVPLSLFRRPVG